MNLSPVASPVWESIRGVRFTMLYGPTPVTVLVTHAALDDIDHDCNDCRTSGIFHKHREALEHIASIKHRRGLIDESGAVIVQAGDLKPSHP